MGKEEAELRDGGRLKDIRAFIDSLYGHDLHTKHVDSLAAATLGVMTGTSLAVAMIGQALAQARGLVTKHAIKQVDRLPSNSGIGVWESFARWVPHLVGSRNDIVIAMDWTDCHVCFQGFRTQNCIRFFLFRLMDEMQACTVEGGH